MDSFKFRAWDRTENVYIEDAQFTYDYGCEGGKGSFKHRSFGDLLEDKNYILEQCTGLKDKNGKLIYEGDILKSNDTILKVFWWSERGSFAFEKEKNVFTTSQQSIALCGFEVIGNIHENPELLEDKNG